MRLLVVLAAITLTACIPTDRYLIVREADISGGTIIGSVSGAGTTVTIQESEQPLHSCVVVARWSEQGRTVATTTACKD